MTRVCVVTAYALASFLAIPAAGQTRIDLKNQGRNIDFTSAASTKPFRTGTELPAGCSIGEVFFKTNADPGKNWYACTAADTWTLQSGGAEAMGGDVTGAPSAATVERIQGRRVANAAPAEGHVLYWNAAAGQWEPRSAGASSGSANVSYSFTGQTAITIPAATHGLGTPNLIVACYDIAEGRVEPGAVVVNPANYDVTVQFAAAQSGRCVINGTGGGGGGVSATETNVFAGGTTQTFLGALIASDSERTAPAKAGMALPATCSAGDQFFKKDAPAGQNLYFCTAINTWTQMRGGDVTSVFGRMGAVTAQAGDYMFAQIGGTVADVQIASGVNAAKIGGGGVTNTEFGHLANVSSDIQAQINAKAAASHGHTAGGDLTGDTASATVTRIQSRAVSATAPADGQALVWSATGDTWQPANVAGGGGGMASLLGDFGVSRANTTTLSIGANCTTATPCNARFGNVVYQFTRGCTATLSGGTGSAYIYVGSGGVLTVGHNLTVAASAGCMSQGSVTSFPGDSIPLFTWSATSGAWDEAGGRDFRGWLSQRSISAGTGIATVESGGRTTVAIDAALVPTFLTTAATIDLPSIAAGACSSDYTIPLTGAVAGDAIAPGWPGSWQAGLSGSMRVSAANTIAVRVCNASPGAIDPVSATYRATIVRAF